MTTLVLPGISAVYANWGRWIADCAWCDSAVALQNRAQQGFRCKDCGRCFDVVWPEPAMADGVERLLLMRPNPKTRNWRTGETLHDLLEENVTHGVGIEEIGQSISIVGDRIVADSLPATPRLELMS